MRMFAAVSLLSLALVACQDEDSAALPVSLPTDDVVAQWCDYLQRTEIAQVDPPEALVVENPVTHQRVDGDVSRSMAERACLDYLAGN